MKFDRHIRHRWQSHGLKCRLGFSVAVFIAISVPSHADLPGISDAKTTSQRSDQNAETLLRRSIEHLAFGDAFDANLRQRVWVGNRAIVGVGHYEQSGHGTGRYSLEMTIHDGDTRQTMKQISDGKLAWHRSQIGETIAIRRVDLGRIDEFEREWLMSQSTANSTNPTPFGPATTSSHASDPLPSRLLVGGLVELLDRIGFDYVLKLKKGTVERKPVWFLHGQLREAARSRIVATTGRDMLPELCPVEVRVAIAATADATGFGAGIPLQIEFYSAPPANMKPASSLPISTVSNHGEQAADSDGQSAASSNSSTGMPAGRIISLLEVYSLRRIEASPEERFRFLSDDRQVTFTNDTQRYLDRSSERTKQ